MDHHYDLLARPGWRANSILIVSPYVEKTFFERIIKDLKPAKLAVVIDDGCRAEDLDMVQRLTRKGTQVKAALGGAKGLVHAKIFHVEWRTSGGARAHTFVYGSGNATRQAFDGDFNSELMCKARLTAANHAPLLRWLEEVRAAACDPSADGDEIDPLRDFPLADGIRVRLPGMTIRAAGDKANNFDLWLQRGRLLNMYRPDVSFLRVQVNLLAELPPGDLDESIRRIGFEPPQRRRLSITYIPAALHDSAGESDAAGNWRSRFFLSAQLGDWCSDACFREESHQFKKNRDKERLENLRLLEELGNPDLRREACSHFLVRIDRLWETFGDRAANYLESSNGKVDRDAYQKIFDQQLGRDLALAEDPEFKDRYINGCEVIDVPRFRMDTKARNSFTGSFIRQLHLEWLKSRSQSLIFQRTHSALSKLKNESSVKRIFDDPKELEQQLRSAWNAIIEDDDVEETTLGEYIDSYAG